MTDSEYQKLADATFRRIEEGFRDVDVERVDCERAGDVLSLTFADGKRCVINTQRPTRQIWMAAGARAWHFSYDAEAPRWFDDKDATIELFAHIARVVHDLARVEVVFG